MLGIPNIYMSGGVEKGQMALLDIVIGATALSDRVKSTLGPRGRDKMLVSPGVDMTVNVTNDGATILKSMEVSNPSAKLLVDVSKTQDAEVGDGTTSVCVLSGELLKQAEALLHQGIHAQTIIQGYRLAHDTAQAALKATCIDHSADEVAFKEDLLNIARTTLSSKILNVHLDVFSQLAVDAVLRLKGSTNLEQIHVLKKLGGSIRDSFLAEGFLLDKKIGVGQPKRVENAKVLVANTAMDTDKIKVYGARVRVTSIADLAKIEEAEKARMTAKCDKIIKHGINCFINRQLIYNFPEEIFADAGVMAIEHADFEGVERLALVLGAQVTSTFDDPQHVKLGECKLIDEVMIGEDKLIRFTGCKAGEACTIVLRGSSQHLLDEAERSLHDALCVLSQTVMDARTVLGAGCSEIIMAQAVDAEAKKTPGKKALAMEGFAKALRSIPTIIATNAGLDGQQLVTEIQAAHTLGNTTFGIDINTGEVGDVRTLAITESFKCKSSVVNYASEAAEMLLRCDQVIKCAPRQRQR
jgi:T-complex protein 1 subunit beta